MAKYDRYNAIEKANRLAYEKETTEKLTGKDYTSSKASDSKDKDYARKNSGTRGKDR